MEITSTKSYKWRVGYWMSSKKSKKFNFDELTELCKSVGIELVQLNLESEIAPQGHFDAIIHKLSDVLVQADKGDEEAKKMIARLERYINANPDIVVFDPLPSVRTLCDRFLQYLLIKDICRTDNCYTPKFVDFTTPDVNENLEKMKKHGVTFPCICKPFVAHGSHGAHEMSIIFGEHGLKDVKPPCVAQSFVPHNAVLYKVFVIGNRYFICPRPSLKNFFAGNHPTIFFHTHDVSKDGCTSELSEMSDEPESPTSPPPSGEKIAAVVRDVRDRTGLALFGLDIIVEKGTHYHYIIDVNALPGYEGVPDFHDHLLQLFTEALNNRDIQLTKRQPHQLSPSRTLSVPAMPVSYSLTGPTKHSETTIATIPTQIEETMLRGRGRTPPDSGIGSCTESDTSDSERKLIAALKIRQQQQQQQQVANVVGLSRPHSMSGFIPSWQRIKKFYGIPKPLVLPMSETEESNLETKNVIKAKQEISPPQHSKPTMTTRKPRSQTLP